MGMNAFQVISLGLTAFGMGLQALGKEDDSWEGTALDKAKAEKIRKVSANMAEIRRSRLSDQQLGLGTSVINLMGSLEGSDTRAAGGGLRDDRERLRRARQGGQKMAAGAEQRFIKEAAPAPINRGEEQTNGL